MAKIMRLVVILSAALENQKGKFVYTLSVEGLVLEVSNRYVH